MEPSPESQLASKILLIEDESTVRLAVTEMLSYEGYEVVTAVDGEDGLRELHKERPALLLLDIMMPNMNGLDLLEELRANPEFATLPVVVFSAYHVFGERALLLGATRFLQKPAPLDLLASTIEECLRPMARTQPVA